MKREEGKGVESLRLSHSLRQSRRVGMETESPAGSLRALSARGSLGSFMHKGPAAPLKNISLKDAKMVPPPFQKGCPLMQELVWMVLQCTGGKSREVRFGAGW